MNYKFTDGEKTLSSYEYELSKFLRTNGFIYEIDYFRDVEYKTFIHGYEGKLNCDYVLKTGEKTIYIEIAGMLCKNVHKSSFIDNVVIANSKAKEKYRQKLMLKEQMLKEAHKEYYILFPSDVQEDFLMSIFSKDKQIIA